jgi:alkanesulfonate monooxygenase SsuD/methylene tetrahydromethanopterin reductase-like flavin-dependent oxidoreductase (luciferase family)
MHIGLFQLLPRGSAANDRELVEQALWEADFAEQHHFESIWIAEHHFSGYGSIGVPSVYAAAIAQRTRRIRIGYAVAAVPLHHPLRLAEEISWVDHLCQGRLSVGVGSGFSPFEFAPFDVPLDERHTRFTENFDLIRRALAEPEITYQGHRVAIRPRPFTQPHPPFYWASTSDVSLRKAAAERMPLLFGLEPISEIAERLHYYRAVRTAAGASPDAITREIAEMYVLRRICIAETDAEAIRDVQEPLRWNHEMKKLVHEQCEPIVTLPANSSSAAAATVPLKPLDADFFGAPATIKHHLHQLHALGLRKIIAWFHFGNMPYPTIRRSMQLMATHLIPKTPP